ncbi:putative receptor protein kinase TMK1 [Morella rubra]|uniref:non-specific serine/threonine protein kinase n=1 Tax=Morella rubra TaxID=262757 RepID=A0A6A1ULN0_9ROSI|nr:putative receptor protein kinase TMK1 [Morella rubra]
MVSHRKKLVFPLILSLLAVVFGDTDPNDVAILNQFKKGLQNPELLKWPVNDADPCGSKWNHVFCNGKRVAQIQVQNLGLRGPLPQNLGQLSMLTDLGLQKNNFTGPLPSLSGLSSLKNVYLDNNGFDTIPGDFFDGLESLEVLALDYINLNASTGWMFPSQLQNSPLLRNLSCMSCNLAGQLPSFLGNLSSLANLKLSGNNLIGEIPASYRDMNLQILWLNNPNGKGLTGPIDVVTTMTSLNSLWLHGNQFTGEIPESIGNLTLLKDLNLNGNQLVGLIPDRLANMELDNLDLSNNRLMGPIPNFKANKSAWNSNAFCQSTPGVLCAPVVMELLEFLGWVNYPSKLVSSWTGNDPCGGPWLGLSCNPSNEVSIINMPKFSLNGSLSPAIAKLDALTQIRLQNNYLTGPIPQNWTSLKYLTTLDVSGNNISPPLPKFSSTVNLVIDGNPHLSGNQSLEVPPAGSPPAKNPSSGGSQTPTKNPSSPTSGSSSNGNDTSGEPKSSKRSIFVSVVAPVASVVVVAFLAIPLSVYCCRKRKGASPAPNSIVIHPRDPSDSDNTVKIVVANNTNGSASTLTGSGSGSRNSSGMGESHVIEAGNLIISVQVLRNVTKNFAPENELGRGGFGVVYKGELDDGTTIAVKRMEAGIITSKALDEFHSEIKVLSKVRHRHLVSLLGYSTEGNERILVYEYMPQGALSRHLFHWKDLKLEPLTWKRRLNIALDVARAMEYLHTLAHRSFIHRDLKSSNILLGDDYRAKVSDFGLVKLAPDGEKSVVTRLAGTFGYLAPEYAVTGKITTKVDVFSFGVVLMELLTGLMALDDQRSEESQYLAAWFWRIKSDPEKLRAAIDPALDAKEEIFESISIIAELAGHCTAREPNQRPDMGHAVNVLSPLVEKWKPFDDDAEEYSGIDYSLPLNQMVKGWQEGKDLSYMALEDSKDSIPTRPTGFAESFTSADGR